MGKIEKGIFYSTIHKQSGLGKQGWVKQVNWLARIFHEIFGLATDDQMLVTGKGPNLDSYCSRPQLKQYARGECH